MNVRKKQKKGWQILNIEIGINKHAKCRRMKMIKQGTQSPLLGDFEGVFTKFSILWVGGTALQSMYVGGKRTTFRNQGSFFLGSGYKSEIIRLVNQYIHLPRRHLIGPTKGLIQVIDLVTFISHKASSSKLLLFCLSTVRVQPQQSLYVTG